MAIILRDNLYAAIYVNKFKTCGIFRNKNAVNDGSVNEQ